MSFMQKIRILKSWSVKLDQWFIKCTFSSSCGKCQMLAWNFLTDNYGFLYIVVLDFFFCFGLGFFLSCFGLGFCFCFFLVGVWRFGWLVFCGITSPQGNTNLFTCFNGIYGNVWRLPRTPRQNGDCRESVEIKESCGNGQNPQRNCLMDLYH